MVGPGTSRPEIDLNKDPPPDPDDVVGPGAIRPEIDLNKEPPLDLDLYLDPPLINQATSHRDASQQNRPGAGGYTPHSGASNSRVEFAEELKKAIAANIDESRRCECPMPNCVHLGCPCFSTAMYCGESCNCTGCLNRNKYDYIVDLAQKGIMLENPLAFAPKGFRRVTRPMIVMEKRSTESSASNSQTSKSRCSCKNDKCTQHYCDCFKAKVGCSDECKCDGCRNFYGVKEVTNQSVDQTKPKNDMEPPDSSSSTR